MFKNIFIKSKICLFSQGALIQTLSLHKNSVLKKIFLLYFKIYNCMEILNVFHRLYRCNNLSSKICSNSVQVL